MILCEWQSHCIFDSKGCTVLCAVSCTKECQFAECSNTFLIPAFIYHAIPFSNIYLMLCIILFTVYPCLFLLEWSKQQHKNGFVCESVLYQLFPNFSPLPDFFAYLHLFLLSSSNTSFAPCCSIIADVEFHFCSTGLWHILRGGLTKLTCSPPIHLTTRLELSLCFVEFQA